MEGGKNNRKIEMEKKINRKMERGKEQENGKRKRVRGKRSRGRR